MKYRSLSATFGAILLCQTSIFGALAVTTPVGGIPQYDGSGSGSFTVELSQSGVGQQFQDPNRVVIMTVNYVIPASIFTDAASFNLGISGTTVTFDSTVDIPSGTNLQFTFSYDTPFWARGADGMTVNGVTPPDFTNLPLDSDGAALGTSIRGSGFRTFYDASLTSVSDVNQGDFTTGQAISDNFDLRGNPTTNTSTFLSSGSGNAGIRGRLASRDNQISSLVWNLTAVTDIDASETPFTFTTDGALEAVPEPSAALLGALGILALFKRRRS